MRWSIYCLEPFDDRACSRIANSESLARHAVEERLAARRAVENDVADKDVFFGHKRGGFGRIDDEASAGQAFEPVNWNLMVPSGNPAAPYLRAISPESMAPTVRCTLRIGILISIGVWFSIASLA